MTYGELLQLLPTMLNRTAADLSSRVDLIRRAVKWSYAHLLTRADLDCFYTFADVDLTNPTGIEWQSFTDINTESVSLSQIKNINLLSDDGMFEPIELIRRQHKRFREIIRRPLDKIVFGSSYPQPETWPVAYTLNTKLHLHWFDAKEIPSTSRIRIEGNVAFPSFLDSSGLNDAQQDAVDWVLQNGENYLIAKSMQFLMMYMKEDDRFTQYTVIAEQEFNNLCLLNMGVQSTGDTGYDLD